METIKIPPEVLSSLPEAPPPLAADPIPPVVEPAMIQAVLRPAPSTAPKPKPALLKKVAQHHSAPQPLVTQKPPQHDMESRPTKLAYMQDEPEIETKTEATASIRNTTPTPYRPPDGQAAYLNNPKPSYPMVARRRGYEGIVLLNVMVNIRGRPDAVSVKRGSGHHVLDRAALRAVRQWHFIPAKRAGEPVNASVEVPIQFTLSNGKTKS